ncbi:hypothetical protein FQN57_001109 [Myotisia sp. PD_48]|nr:hypothetical protein FQN57_001109 [Myotisia sp. PD_48]
MAGCNFSPTSRDIRLLAPTKLPTSALPIHNPKIKPFENMANGASYFGRGLLLATRLMQWFSAVIVMGIMSYFIRRFSTGLHITYTEVIAVVSVVLFLPGLVSPLVPQIGIVALPIDIIFCFLWLTSFIFAAQDYTTGNCFARAPARGRCSLKRTVTAFAFLAFFGCFVSAGLEIWNLWSYRQKQTRTVSEEHSKELPRQSGDTAITGATT